MPRPSVLSRRNPYLHKNDFGHVLIVAGSSSMLGASALCSLAAMRSGAGLVTAAVPKSLNLTLHKKLSPVVMTLPVPQTSKAAYSSGSFAVIQKVFQKFNAIAIGPGIGSDKATMAFVRQMIEKFPGPMVVDADALNALAGHLEILLKAKGPRILTPHPGEMSRLVGKSVRVIESDRTNAALSFAKRCHCIVVLKGNRTIIASHTGQRIINKTGNVGMATAGSGDVLTGIIAALLAQGVAPFEAAHWGVYYHGRAGDVAIKTKSKASLIATDLIEQLTSVIK